MTNYADTFASAGFHEEYLAAKIQSGIQEALDARGLSRVDLANLMNVSKARVSQIFSDNANFTVKTIARACHALGISAADLLAEKIETKSAYIDDQDADPSRLIGFTSLLQAAKSTTFRPSAWNLDEFIEPANRIGLPQGSSNDLRPRAPEPELFSAANDPFWSETFEYIKYKRAYA